jgi:GAF domain-containing protein/HAMP domain-containing protein
VVVVGSIFAVANLTVYAILYIRYGSLAVLINALGIALGLVGLVVAFWLVSRGRLDAAAYWVFSAMLVAYGVGELVWQGQTWPNVIGGVLLIVIVGRLTLPGRWKTWLAVAGVYGLWVLMINLIEPLPRQNALDDPLLTYFDLVTLVLLLGVTIWQVIRAIARGKIRNRLLAAFVLLVLLPTIILSAVSAVLGFNNGQQQAYERLRLAADQKRTELEDWVTDLEAGLDAAITDEEAPYFVWEVLGEDPNPDAFITLRGYFGRYLIRTELFDALFLLNLEGEVVVSTDDVIPWGIAHAEQRYFTEAMEVPFILIMTDNPFSEQPMVVASCPATSAAGVLLGVAVGYVNIDRLDEIVPQEIALGNTGEIHLVDADGALLTQSSAGGRGDPLQTEGVDLALSQASGEAVYANHAGRDVLGVYHWLPKPGVALLAEQEQSEILTSIYQALALNFGVAVVLVSGAVIASLLTSRSIANPLTRLAETASQVAAGSLGQVIEVERADEIGTLAQAFNDMTVQLQELVGSLEERVRTRTLELERRSTYLEASAQVVQAANSILDVDRLIQQVVEMIRERFDLYYVGLFLIDQLGEWAVLRAGTGEAGRVLLERGHRIKVGEGMVGWSVANAQLRVASDVGDDAVRAFTAELPETRSEAALPLRARGQVIGALTVQSAQPNAFDPQMLGVFQTMADQMAIGVDNARLLAESQSALEAAGRASGQLSVEAWKQLLRTRSDLGYQSTERGVSIVEGNWRPEMEQALNTGQIAHGDDNGGNKRPLAVPIKLRGEVIGVLDTHKPANSGEWTADDLAVIETLAQQVGQALEGARLYQDTQRRAIREQLTGHIVDKMRRAVDMESLMRTTIEEVAAALGASSAFVQVGVGTATGGNGSDMDGRLDDSVAGGNGSDIDGRLDDVVAGEAI